MDAYIQATDLKDRDAKEPLFRSVNPKRKLTDRPLSRVEVFLMIKRRARAAGLPPGLADILKDECMEVDQ